MRRWIAWLQHDERAISTVEFALIAPVFLLLLLGVFEIGHTMYVKTVLMGQLQKAARDTSLEDASDAARQAAIQKLVTDGVHTLSASANVSFSLKSYHDYANAKDPGEEFSDRPYDGLPPDGICNHGEAFVDSDGNGVWDADGSVAGRGGAQDVVLMTATVSYPRMGLGRLFFANPVTTLAASTLLRNQPSDLQSTPALGTCA